MFKTIIITMLMILSLSVNAEDLTLSPDFNDAASKTLDYLTSFQDIQTKHLFNFIIYSIACLSFFTLCFLACRFVTARLDHIALEADSKYKIFFNLVRIISASGYPFLWIFSLPFGIFIMCSIAPLILPLFYEASVVDKTKLLADSYVKAKYANVLYVQKSAIYNFNRFQFVRENAFKYQKDGFLNCLSQHYDLDIGRNKGLVVDENARNLNSCSSTYLNIKGVGLGNITYDNSLSVSYNNSYLAKNSEVANLVDELIRNVCAESYSNTDQTDILTNCSDMKQGVVVTSGDKNYVIPITQSNKSKEQIKSEIESIVESMTSLDIAEISKMIDDEAAKLDDEIKKIEVNPFTLITITMKVSSLKSDIEAKANHIIGSHNIEVKYENIQNNTAEKVRYSAEKYLTDKTIDNYSVKLQIEKLFKEVVDSKGFSEGRIDRYINGLTGNIFTKNGFSGPECRTNHKECNMASFNVLSNIIETSTVGMNESLAKYMGFSALAIITDIKFDNVKAQTATKVASSGFKMNATFQRWHFFISFFATITILVGAFLPTIGQYLSLVRLTMEHAVTSPIKVLMHSLKKPIESNEVDMKWSFSLPVLWIAPTLFMFAFVILLYLLNIASIIISFNIHIVSATIMPISQDASGVFNLVAHIMFYVSMTFYVIKTRKINEQSFIFGVINSILTKVERMSNQFADDTEKAMNKIFNSSK